MGTRHLICVVKNGEYKIAQYGQWDGYPEGQGVDILQFISDPENLTSLEDNLSKIRFLELDGRDKAFMDEYEKNAPTWSNEPDNRTEEQARWFRTYMSRDIGAGILSNVAHSEDEEILLENSVDFAADGLFCEWGYVIDLDNRTFEVYKGFLQGAVEGRFKDMPTDGEYSPIGLAKTYNLDDLPGIDTYAFIGDFVEPEDEA